ncbi:NAD(P)-dependent oxidoreductase, partial [Chromobacterium piscinae]
MGGGEVALRKARLLLAA